MPAGYLVRRVLGIGAVAALVGALELALHHVSAAVLASGPIVVCQAFGLVLYRNTSLFLGLIDLGGYRVLHLLMLGVVAIGVGWFAVGALTLRRRFAYAVLLGVVLVGVPQRFAAEGVLDYAMLALPGEWWILFNLADVMAVCAIALLVLPAWWRALSRRFSRTRTLPQRVP